MVRKLSLAGGLIVIFAITVLILLRILPGPLKPTDYLVIGTLSTFFCILLLFVFLLATSGRRADAFYKRRK